MGTVAQNILNNARATRVALEERGLEAVRVHVPQEVDVRAIRRKLGMSQAEFAARFAFDKKTVQNWEQGQRRPEGPARVLLHVIEREHEAVERALQAA